MAKILLPVIGAIATVGMLTSSAFAKVTAAHKADIAVPVIVACIIVGALIDRVIRPKPKAAPQRTGYPFAGPQRPRR
jgi:hypothetical protein